MSSSLSSLDGSSSCPSSSLGSKQDDCPDDGSISSVSAISAHTSVSLEVNSHPSKLPLPIVLSITNSTMYCTEGSKQYSPPGVVLSGPNSYSPF